MPKINSINFPDVVQRAERIANPVLAFRINNPIGINHEFVFVFALRQQQGNGVLAVAARVFHLVPLGVPIIEGTGQVNLAVWIGWNLESDSFG